MPLVICLTSLKSEDVPPGFEDRLCVCVKDVLNKPLKAMVSIVHTDLRASKGGTPGPVFILQLHSMNVFDERRNPDYFPKIFQFLTTELNIPADRMAIEFIDLPAHMAEAGK